MEKRKKNKLVKIIKVVFAVLAVVTLICTTAVNTFASVAYTNDGEYVYSGNVDYSLTYNLQEDTIDPDPLYGAKLTLGVSPLFSYAMLNNVVNQETAYIESYSDYFNFGISYDDYEATDGLINAIPTIGNLWKCQSTYTSYLNRVYYLYSVHIEARDFYFYVNPNQELDTFNGLSDIIAESVLYLQSDTMYGLGGSGVIYYTEAGKENNAENRMTYEYTIGSDETAFIYESGAPYYFSVLPTDDTFEEKYTEPQLIYIEYFSFVLPVHTRVDILNTSVLYYNLYYDFRNDDITAFEPPITPIDPGIFADYTSWIGTAVSGFLDFQIVQGFTLGGIVMVLIAFTLCLWFLKVFAGG